MTFIENTPSRNAPDIGDGGLVPAKFVSLKKINHPDWATPNGKFGPDNGDRFHWLFVLTDDEGEELYDEESGEPVTVESANSTNFNTKSDKSKNAAWLKAVSPEAFAKIDAGMGVNAEDLESRPVMLLLSVKDNGWPKLENVLPAAKKRASRGRAAVSDEE